MLLERGELVELPPLSCGRIWGTAAIDIDEGNSAAGQVLLLGEQMHDGESVATVQVVDLATGVSVLQAALLHQQTALSTFNQ
jgi:hypothetical protein